MATKLISGGVHCDNRGKLKFFNEFDMSAIRRFYVVEHNDVTIVRAWQGHLNECKWFCVINGTFKVILVKPDDWISPSVELPYEEYILNAHRSEILHIPKGVVTGFQALEKSSKVIIFSDVTLEESLRDDFRFDKKLWYNWSQK